MTHWSAGVLVLRKMSRKVRFTPPSTSQPAESHNPLCFGSQKRRVMWKPKENHKKANLRTKIIEKDTFVSVTTERSRLEVIKFSQTHPFERSSARRRKAPSLSESKHLKSVILHRFEALSSSQTQSVNINGTKRQFRFERNKINVSHRFGGMNDVI